MEYFWGMGYITVILFAIIQNGAFQNDFVDFFRIPFMWYMRFCDWLVYPTYDNGFNQKIAYKGGEAWVIRILAIVAVLFILGIVTAGFTVQNKKSQIVLNTSINSSSYVSFSILPMIYQYFWRVRLAKNKPE